MRYISISISIYSYMKYIYICTYIYMRYMYICCTSSSVPAGARDAPHSAQ
jgi:hypothetical protein